MARKPMVTRTITSTKVTLMCVNTTFSEITNETIILPRTYKDKNQMLKIAKDMFETEEVKVVDIVDSQVETQLYGMTEDEFVRCAQPIYKDIPTMSPDEQ